MSVFSEQDKQIATSRDEDGDERVEVRYSAPVWIVRDRLEVMGFTLDGARAIFTKGVSNRLAEINSLRDDEDRYKPLDDLYAEKASVLGTLTLELWMSEMRALKVSGAHSIWENENVPDDLKGYCLPASKSTPLLRYLLNPNEDHILSFETPDLRYLLRAALEFADPLSPVVQDVTDVIYAGYYAPDDPIADDARKSNLEHFPNNARVIVLTEGPTDHEILSQSLSLLYPHLVPLYSFMDFGALRSPGGAGQLVATVKAFASAGVSNRIVALFDNDTAAADALRSLDLSRLPENMRVLTYPPLPNAKLWPTTGPQGTVAMDVNGLAGSIELYLGSDVLHDAGRLLAPVHWKGYVSALERYQGEVANKDLLHKRFAAKVIQAKADSRAIGPQDWSGLRAILDLVRHAFLAADASPSLGPMRSV
jgi:hypothetical protein